MSKIYLACPYSHPDKDMREVRFELANAHAAKLMRKGILVFSPISHTHPIAVQCELPLGFDFWEKFDKAWIDWADELWVLNIPGWRESVGVQAEIKIAKDLGKPVIYIYPDGE